MCSLLVRVLVVIVSLESVYVSAAETRLPDSFLTDKDDSLAADQALPYPPNHNLPPDLGIRSSTPCPKGTQFCFQPGINKTILIFSPSRLHYLNIDVCSSTFSIVGSWKRWMIFRVLIEISVTISYSASIVHCHTFHWLTIFANYQVAHVQNNRVELKSIARVFCWLKFLQG